MISALSLIACDTKGADYDKALALIEEGKFTEAKALFEALGDYKDSKDHLSKFRYFPSVQSYVLEDRSGVINITIGGDLNLPIRLTSSNQLKTTDGEYVFDDEGKLIKQTVIQSDNGGEPYVHYIEYTYDDNGNLLAAVYTNKDGNVGYTNSYAYDEDGNLIREEASTPDNGVVYATDYTIGEDGKTTTETYTEGDYTYVGTYIYDDNGNLAKIEYSDDGSYWNYVYNEDGSLAKEEFVTNDNEKYTYAFFYDDNGNVIKETYTHADGTVEKIESEYVLVYVPIELPAGTEFMLIQIFDNL